MYKDLKKRVRGGVHPELSCMDCLSSNSNAFMAANSVTPFCLPQGSQKQLQNAGNTWRAAKRPTGIQGPTSGWINPDAPVNHDYIPADPRRWLSATYEAGAECDGYAPKDAVPSSFSATSPKADEEEDLGYISDEELKGGNVGALASLAWTIGKPILKTVGQQFLKHAADKAAKEIETMGSKALHSFTKSSGSGLSSARTKAIKAQKRAAALQALAELDSEDEEERGGAFTPAPGKFAPPPKGPAKYRPVPGAPLQGVTAHATWADLNTYDGAPRFSDPPVKKRRRSPGPNSKTVRRARLIQKIMAEKKMSMTDASRHIKGMGLEY